MVSLRNSSYDFRMLMSSLSSRTCPKVQSWLYGYDAVAQADQAVQELGLPNGYRAQNGNL